MGPQHLVTLCNQCYTNALTYLLTAKISDISLNVDEWRLTIASEL